MRFPAILVMCYRSMALNSRIILGCEPSTSWMSKASIDHGAQTDVVHMEQDAYSVDNIVMSLLAIIFRH